MRNGSTAADGKKWLNMRQISPSCVVVRRAAITGSGTWRHARPVQGSSKFVAASRPVHVYMPVGRLAGEAPAIEGDVTAGSEEGKFLIDAVRDAFGPLVPPSPGVDEPANAVVRVCRPLRSL